MKVFLFAGALASVLSATVSRPMLAQEPDRYSFYLVVGGDTVLVERVWRLDGQLHGEFADRLRGARVEYLATVNADQTISSVAAHSYRSASDTAGEVATFRITPAQVIAQVGNGAEMPLPGASGLMPIINPSTAFLEQILRRARVIQSNGVASLPIMLIGQSQPTTATATFVGADSVVLDYANVSMRIAFSPDGRFLGGTVPAQRLMILRGDAGLPLVATGKSYAPPPNAPYTAEDVIVRTKTGLTLAGTLTLPTARQGRVPAVVTITGSGPEDRDEESPAIRGYKLFREVADTLGRRGIAVLRMDDRGVGGSAMGPNTVTSEDFADDIRAAVAYLRTRSEIDSLRIGLVGHSEGAIIAPMVAESDAKLKAIVLLAGTASKGSDILRAQQVYAVDSIARARGAERDSALAMSQRATDSMAKTTPWVSWFVAHDPSAVARRVKTPVLILQGKTDHQVPFTEADKLAAAFRAGGNRQVTLRFFPETNHFFLTDTTGRFPYESLPSLSVRRDVLGAIADWLSAALR